MKKHREKVGDILTFGERLRQERKSQQLSQDVIRGLCGLSREAWSRYETGQQFPSFINLVLLADGLNINTDYLLGRTTERKNLNL